MANKIKASEAMMMNRKARRALGKINKVKIPGLQKPIVGKQKDKQHEN